MQSEIVRLLELPVEEARPEGLELVRAFRDGLNRGEYRAAERIDGVWRANLWVKQGILLAFRLGLSEDRPLSDEFYFCDKDTLPLRQKPASTFASFRVDPASETVPMSAGT